MSFSEITPESLIRRTDHPDLGHRHLVAARGLLRVQSIRREHPRRFWRVYTTIHTDTVEIYYEGYDPNLVCQVFNNLMI